MNILNRLASAVFVANRSIYRINITNRYNTVLRSCSVFGTVSEAIQKAEQIAKQFNGYGYSISIIK